MIFSHQKKSRVILALLMLLVIGLSFVPPKIVSAQQSTLPAQLIDYIMQMVNWIKDYAIKNIMKYYEQITSQIQQWTKTDILDQRSLKEAWNEARFELLKELSDDIIEWSQNDGNAAFIKDWQAHIAGITDDTAQRYISEQIDTAPMYEAYAQNVKKDIWQIDQSMERDSFTKQTEGSISNEEMNAFYSGDFTWERWEAALESNYYIDLFTALDNLEMKKYETYEGELARAQADLGFIGDESTPGIIKAYATQRASMMDFDYLLQSDDINEYLSSVVDAFINRVKNEGLEKMKTGAYQYHIEARYKPELKPRNQDINYVLAAKNHAQQLLIVLGDINRAFLEQIDEQAKNLAVLEQIKLTGCADSFQKADAEFNEVDGKKRNIEEVKLPLFVLPAIDRLGELIVAIENVEDAKKTGDEAIIELAMIGFREVEPDVIALLQDYEFLNTQATDIAVLYDEALAYLLDIDRATADYIGRRGDENNLTVNTWRMTQFLFGWLDCLRFIGCAESCQP